MTNKIYLCKECGRYRAAEGKDFCDLCTRKLRNIHRLGGPQQYAIRTAKAQKRKTRKRLDPLLAAKWFNKHNPQFNLPEKNILGRSRRKTQP